MYWTFGGLFESRNGNLPTRTVRLSKQPQAGAFRATIWQESARSLACKEWMARPTAYPITKGKKVYLKFWASWCSICLSTLGDTNDLAKAEEGKDYVVLSVVAPTFNGEKSEADFKNWYQSLDYEDFPVLTGQ